MIQQSNELENDSVEETTQEDIFRDKYVRAIADLENFKKRVTKEREELLRYRYQDLLRDLIPILDNFDRALSNTEESGSFLDGMVLVRKLLDDLLVTYGLERIDTTGYLFDPYVHEAVGQRPSEEYESGVVIEEVSRGYIYQDRLLLAAKVIVSV